MVLTGMVVALLCLYALPWWPSDNREVYFLSAARRLTESYDSSSQRPFAATALANAFFRWGHMAFAASLVVAAVSFVRSDRWIAVWAGVIAAVATGWMLYACLNAGLVNLQFSAYLTYLGAALVVVPALLTIVLRDEPAYQDPLAR